MSMLHTISVTVEEAYSIYVTGTQHVELNHRH